jgi:superfamily II DNA or RNA helicase
MGNEDRYEGFQREAVNAIVADFKEAPTGRYLLVIPTGGGKTFTAVKAVSRLYDEAVLSKSDRVLWVVHRDELRVQATETFRKFAEQNDKPVLPGLVDVVMLSELQHYVNQNPGIRFAVIDEAHHAAAASYQVLFARTSMGILGLTATPSRHDGKPLQFTRESYSIGFPDLIELGVLLRPEVITVKGGTYDLQDIGIDSDALEALNDPHRNSRIVSALYAHKDKLHKIIIYVGTKQHARDLYALLKASPLAKDYESLGMILGGERRRYVPLDGTEYREERSDFIRAMKESNRALLVNVDVLTEGYDDPTVNAVVMARPTNSKLVYMQAMGRAVRLDPDNLAKAAFLVEVDDTLPNIQYRIDNRWLYSDVSDTLEPDVVDVVYPSVAELRNRIEAIFNKFNVPADARVIPSISERDRVTMLLFKVYSGNSNYYHLPVVIMNDTRQAAANFFNFLSARIGDRADYAFEEIFGPVRDSLERFPTMTGAKARKHIVGAMTNAWRLVEGDEDERRVDGLPWITFASFRLRTEVASIAPDLVSFTDDMLNREWVRETLRQKSYSDGYVLTKMPLPLKGAVGMFLPPAEFDAVRSTVEALRSHQNAAEPVAQWMATVEVMGSARLPIESRYHQSFSAIVREQLDYCRQLSR